MRKFAVVAAAALMLGGTAYAQNGARSAARDARESMERTGEKAEQKTEQGAERVQERGHTVGDQMAVPGQQTERGQPPAEARGEQQARAGGMEQMKKDSFEIEGKVSKVSKDKLSLNREDAPMAELHVDKSTKIELDGEKATLDQLKQGQDVQASFNLKGDKPMAVEIKAEKKQ